MTDQHSAHAHHPVEHADVHHEESDVNIGGVFGFGAGLFVVATVVYLVVFGLYSFLSHRADRELSGRQYPLAAGQENRLPPEPRLQVNPRQDLRDLRSEERQLLNSYSWVDKNTGVVRIPIDAAMKLTLERGLPSRQSAATEDASK